MQPQSGPGLCCIINFFTSQPSIADVSLIILNWCQLLNNMVSKGTGLVILMAAIKNMFS